MSLPIHNALTYSLEVPSTKKKIKYSPFTVGIQKSLLIAQNSEDMGVMISTLKNVISKSVKDPINVDELAIFDLEYIFLQIRSRSTGEISELIFSCDECDPENEKARVKINLDISQIKVKFPEKINDTIQINDDLGIKLKYPSAALLNEFQDITSETEFMFDVMINSIDYIYSKDEIFKASDYSKDELAEFLDSLLTTDLEKIAGFYAEMPKLSHKVNYRCPECLKEHEKTIEGLANFF